MLYIVYGFYIGGEKLYPQWILENKENYEFILKHNQNYSTVPSRWLKSYLCETKDADDGLLELQRQYKLERLTQNRTDLEICFRAMDWTFQQLLSKIQSDYHGELNANAILRYCKNSKNTVNCLCHATVLTEILLALGFRARKISCLPIDVVPFDNHVLTMVYVPSLNKWIMLDPSMCCYITDEEQNILSIPEIRNCLINDINIHVHTYSRFSNLKTDANESLRINQTDYITYLYKNFFRFISREEQNSKATKDNDIFYMLVPTGYLPTNIIQSRFIEDATVDLRIVDNECFFGNLTQHIRRSKDEVYTIEI